MSQNVFVEEHAIDRFLERSGVVAFWPEISRHYVDSLLRTMWRTGKPALAFKKGEYRQVVDGLHYRISGPWVLIARRSRPTTAGSGHWYIRTLYQFQARAKNFIPMDSESYYSLDYSL